LADEHGSNAEAHDEEPAEAVQQVHTTFELCAVRINNGDGNYCHETIERVKRWEHCFIAVHHDDAENDLNENGELCNAGVPPQCARAQRNQFVCRQCPNACECVANNDNPSPVGVEIVQSLCVHRPLNLPHFIVNKCPKHPSADRKAHQRRYFSIDTNISRQIRDRCIQPLNTCLLVSQSRRASDLLHV